MIPMPPHGASIVSMQMAHEALGGHRDHGREFLTRGARGAFLQRFSAATGIAPRDLLFQHTVAPLHLALLDVSVVEATIEKLLNAYPRVFGSYATPTVRRCPGCVADDLFSCGFAYFRVLHQFKAIQECRKHDLPLEERCSRCGQPFLIWGSGATFSRGGIGFCSRCGCTSGSPLKRCHSIGYLAFSDLLQDVMVGNSVLRPLSRASELSRFASNVDKHSQSYLDFTVESYEALNFDSAARMAGVSPFKLAQALRGDSLPTSPLVTIAAVSIARLFENCFGKFAPICIDVEPRSECVRGDQLAQSIVLRAREFGLPDAVAQSLLRGQSTHGFRLSRRVDAMLSSLSITEHRELRKRKIARQAGEKYPELNVPIMRRFANGAFDKGIRSRYAFLNHNSFAYRWFRDNDYGWFKRRFPLSNSQNFDAETSRRIIKRAIDGGVSSQTGLMKKDRLVYQWASQNDSCWLNSALPLLRNPPRTFNIQSGRRAARRVKQAGVHGLSELFLMDRGLWHWLRFNDRAFMRKLFPPRWLRLRPSVQQARREAMSFKASSRSRSSLRTEHTALYRWLMTNDRVWFDDKFPA